MTRGGRTRSPCGTGDCLAAQDPTCWDSQAVRSRWAVCLLHSSIPSGAPAGQLGKTWVPSCPGIAGEVLGVTSQWRVTSGRCCPWRHWHWDQHSSACALINLPGISAESIPTDLWPLCSMRMGNSLMAGSAGIYCTMSCPSSLCHVSESGYCQPGEVLRAGVVCWLLRPMRGGSSSMVRSSCSHTGKLHGCGRAVSCQLSLLAPPCTEEKVVARCEMVPPLLC